MNDKARAAAPLALAAALALAYVVISPPSLDLAAHLLRAKLFDAEGFGLWNNWWYAGHHVPGYSVLFPPLAALLTPQLVAALASVATAAAFTALARGHFGEDAWLGSLWFAAATATDLFTGRLTFAFGLLPALLCALALARRRPALAAVLAVLTALASPVAALFAALAAAAYALAEPTARRLVTGAIVATAALAPVLALAIAFPEGGSEPFAWGSLWPVLAVCAVAVIALPRGERVLRVGALLYLAGALAAYVVTSPIGSNSVRLAALVAGPLAALVWWRPHPRLLVLAVVPLLYLQWQPPVRDVVNASGDRSASAAYWQPLLGFLRHQPGPPFRVEVPFTKFHMEAYRLAPEFPIARGWERQLDIKDNHLFYDGSLSPATYAAWLHRLAIRFVAVSDAALDYSGQRERRLIDAGLPYLRPVFASRHWRVYAVAGATALLDGPGVRLTAIGPNSLSFTVTRSGDALARVHFTPYWQISGVAGCVAPESGDFTRLSLRGTGRARLEIAFAFSRVHASAPRCGAPPTSR